MIIEVKVIIIIDAFVTGFVPVLEFDNLDSRPGKSWNFGPGPGQS